MSAYMYICMYICMYMYLLVYIYIHVKEIPCHLMCMKLWLYKIYATRAVELLEASTVDEALAC